MTSAETHSPSHRANASYESEPYYIEGMPEILQIEGLKQIAGSYDRLAQNPNYLNSDGTPDDEKIENTLSLGLRQYLTDAGIEAGGSEEQQEEYSLAYSVLDQAARMSMREWVGDGDQGSPAYRVFEELLDHYQPLVQGRHRADAPAVQIDNVHSNLDAEHDEAATRLFELSKEYAEKVSERSKRMIEGSKTTADTNKLKDGYTEIVNGEEVYHEGLADLISALAAEAYDEFEAEGLSRDEIVQKIDEFVAEQTDSIIAQMEEHRMAEYNNSSATKKWFLDKWASWGNEKGLITKGKLKKAAVFAVPGAVLGAGLLPLAATAGLGVAAAGTIVMGTRSIGRRLAGAKLDSVANSERVATQQSADIRGKIAATANREKAIKEGSLDLLEVIDTRTEFYRKRNRRRMVGGLAIAVTVGLVSSRAASAVEGLAHYIGEHNPFAHSGSDASLGKLPMGGHDRDGDGIINRFDHDRDGDGVLNGHDYKPDNPDISHTPDAPDAPDATAHGDMFTGHQGSSEFTRAGQKDFNKWISRNGGHEVKPGDSVWNLSEQYLHSRGIEHPTTYQVDAVKDGVLKEFRAKGLVDSNGWLKAGDTIKIK